MRPELLTSEEALEQAKAFARAQRDKGWHRNMSDRMKFALGLTMSAHRRILLQKSFRGADRKFLEPLVRFMRGDVRDHIG